ncbi:hypothetical protein Cadr_000027061 [Camelus dromedarius]|uniref:Uncharacterized protein n=1 Tax=Camelus dromedarius TaxID=9838 RepID=A0A5N4C5G4_CAMDR|nr:hypothetical protein Cadr_000027061 [Camelus dromedarius]
MTSRLCGKCGRLPLKGAWALKLLPLLLTVVLQNRLCRAGWAPARPASAWSSPSRVLVALGLGRVHTSGGVALAELVRNHRADGQEGEERAFAQRGGSRRDQVVEGLMWGCKPDVGVRAAGVLSKVFCLKGIPELHTREEVMKNGMHCLTSWFTGEELKAQGAAVTFPACWGIVVLKFMGCVGTGRLIIDLGMGAVEEDQGSCTHTRLRSLKDRRRSHAEVRQGAEEGEGALTGWGPRARQSVDLPLRSPTKGPNRGGLAGLWVELSNLPLPPCKQPAPSLAGPPVVGGGTGKSEQQQVVPAGSSEPGTPSGSHTLIEAGAAWDEGALCRFPREAEDQSVALSVKTWREEGVSSLPASLLLSMWMWT